MPWPKGKPRAPNAGRKKGTPNRSTATVHEILARLNCNPFEIMGIIATNTLPCGVCRGTGKTKYQLKPGQHDPHCSGRPKKSSDLCACEGIGERTCQSCYGTLYEACNPAERGKMAAQLAEYVAPKRKALEVSGELEVHDRIIEERLNAGRLRAAAAKG